MAKHVWAAQLNELFMDIKTINELFRQAYYESLDGPIPGRRDHSAPPPPTCECGSEAVGSPKHSDWCPLHEVTPNE